jgi:hypothetical protein
LSLALVMLSTGPVFAKSGPDNPGHHYGQKKHAQQPPPPAPNSQPSAGEAGSTTTESRVSLTIHTIGLGTNGPRPVADVKRVQTWPSGAGLEWLLLLILPLLLAVWVVVAARTVATVVRRSRSRRGMVASAG